VKKLARLRTSRSDRDELTVSVPSHFYKDVREENMRFLDKKIFDQEYFKFIYHFLTKVRTDAKTIDLSSNPGGSLRSLLRHFLEEHQDGHNLLLDISDQQNWVSDPPKKSLKCFSGFKK